MIKNTASFENETNTAFNEFSNCGYGKLKSNLDKRNIRKMSIGDFKFFLEVFNRNGNIPKSKKYNFLKDYTYEYEYEGKRYITDFVNELINAIYGSAIDEYTCINISNIVNNLSKVGFTSKDFQDNELAEAQSDEFAEAVTKLINDIFNSKINRRHYNFNSRDISMMLNGLGELGYKKEKLVVSEENGNKIPLNIKALAKRIKSQIKDSDSQDIALTLHGLGKIGYNFDDLKESNIIPKLLEKFNSIEENKTALCYLVLTKGLVATVYGIDQNNLTEEQKQYLYNLKKLISKDVERIIKEAKEKRPEIINDKIDLYDLDKMLMILENQQANLKQQEIEQEKQQLKPEQQLKQKEETKEEGKQQELQTIEDTVQIVEENNKILPRREKEKLAKKIKKQKAQERQLQIEEERQQLKEMKRQRYNEETEATRRTNNEEKQLHKPEKALRTLDQMIEQYNKENKINETKNQQKDTKQKQKEEIKKQPEQENQEKPIVEAEKSEDKCSSKATMLMALSGAAVALSALGLYYTK